MHFRNWNILHDSVLKWFTGHRQDDERDGHKSEKLEESIVNPAEWVCFIIYAEPLLMFPLHPLFSILRDASSYWDPVFIWICAFWLSCDIIICCCCLLGFFFFFLCDVHFQYFPCSSPSVSFFSLLLCYATPTYTCFQFSTSRLFPIFSSAPVYKVSQNEFLCRLASCFYALLSFPPCSIAFVLLPCQTLCFSLFFLIIKSWFLSASCWSLLLNHDKFYFADCLKRRQASNTAH